MGMFRKSTLESNKHLCTPNPIGLGYPRPSPVPFFLLLSDLSLLKQRHVHPYTEDHKIPMFQILKADHLDGTNRQTMYPPMFFISSFLMSLEPCHYGVRYFFLIMFCKLMINFREFSKLWEEYDFRQDIMFITLNSVQTTQPSNLNQYWYSL